MLTVPDYQRILDRLEYKPGWSWEVYDTGFQGTVIAFNARMEDSYNPGEYVDLRIKSYLPYMDEEWQFLEWLRWRLESIEVHECHEWLRWKDEKRPVYDPHGEGTDEPSYKQV